MENFMSLLNKLWMTKYYCLQFYRYGSIAGGYHVHGSRVRSMWSETKWVRILRR